MKSLSFNPKEKGRKIALTFDDGPHPIYTPKVLALLEEHGMKATFFCIGKNIEAYPEIVKRIVTAGHSIGNHTYSHSDFFDFYGENVVLEELKTTNDLVERLTNKKMKFFRPPYGVTNPSIKKALIRSNHVSIGWNVRSLDTVLKQKEKIIQRITDKLKAGDIVLLHDTKKQTIEALEDLLPFIQKQNFEAVTVDTLFKIKCYE